MDTTAATGKSPKTNRISAKHPGFAVGVLCAWFLVTPVASRGAELKQETLKSWNAYVQAENSRLNSDGNSFFRLGEKPDIQRRLREGQILVSQAGHPNPKPIPSGLIHDWIGAAFIPDTTIDSALSAVRDYRDYTEFYKPAVVDSKLLASDRGCDTYSLRVVNKEHVAHMAFDMENKTCYFQVDAQRWYSVTYTTRVLEIHHYGTAEQEELPPGQGSGYIWRMYSIAHFEQKDGGVYIEVEAIALSRDIDAGLRWLVDPIVRHISRNSMLLSLQQTEQAVRLTMAANRLARPPAAVQDGSTGSASSKAEAPNNLKASETDFTNQPK